jgi:hypothetical protein
MELEAQQFIRMATSTLDPRLAFCFVMKSEIMMSKVDPTTIPRTRRRMAERGPLTQTNRKAVDGGARLASSR